MGTGCVCRHFLNVVIWAYDYATIIISFYQRFYEQVRIDIYIVY
jgi:hypothetical protein